MAHPKHRSHTLIKPSATSPGPNLPTPNAQTHPQVSILRVSCKHLKEALVPAPTQSLQQLHQLIPALAADLFQSFMAEVQVRGGLLPGVKV